MATFSLIGVLSIIHIISLAISAIASVVLYRAEKRSKNSMVRQFMWFFIFVFVWMATFFISIFVTTNTFTESAGREIVTAHGFFLVGLAFVARIYAKMALPKYEKLIFNVTMFTAITVIALGVYLQSPFTDITIIKANTIIIQISAILTALILIPVLIFFFTQSFKLDDAIAAVRSFFFGVGFTLLLWHAISLVLIPTYGVIPWIIGEALNVLAFSLLLAGILYSTPTTKITKKYTNAT
mgnify:CR=1 FL=1